MTRRISPREVKRSRYPRFLKAHRFGACVILSIVTLSLATVARSDPSSTAVVPFVYIQDDLINLFLSHPDRLPLHALDLEEWADTVVGEAWLSLTHDQKKMIDSLVGQHFDKHRVEVRCLDLVPTWHNKHIRFKVVSDIKNPAYQNLDIHPIDDRCPCTTAAMPYDVWVPAVGESEDYSGGHILVETLWDSLRLGWSSHRIEPAPPVEPGQVAEDTVCVNIIIESPVVGAADDGGHSLRILGLQNEGMGGRQKTDLRNSVSYWAEGLSVGDNPDASSEVSTEIRLGTLDALETGILNCPESGGDRGMGPFTEKLICLFPAGLMFDDNVPQGYRERCPHHGALPYEDKCRCSDYYTYARAQMVACSRQLFDRGDNSRYHGLLSPVFVPLPTDDYVPIDGKRYEGWAGMSSGCGGTLVGPNLGLDFPLTVLDHAKLALARFQVEEYLRTDLQWDKSRTRDGKAMHAFFSVQLFRPPGNGMWSYACDDERVNEAIVPVDAFRVRPGRWQLRDDTTRVFVQTFQITLSDELIARADSIVSRLVYSMPLSIEETAEADQEYRDVIGVPVVIHLESLDTKEMLFSAIDERSAVWSGGPPNHNQRVFLPHPYGLASLGSACHEETIALQHGPSTSLRARVSAPDASTKFFRSVKPWRLVPVTVMLADHQLPTQPGASSGLNLYMYNVASVPDPGIPREAVGVTATVLLAFGALAVLLHLSASISRKGLVRELPGVRWAKKWLQKTEGFYHWAWFVFVPMILLAIFGYSLQFHTPPAVHLACSILLIGYMFISVVGLARTRSMRVSADSSVNKALSAVKCFASFNLALICLGVALFAFTDSPLVWRENSALLWVIAIAWHFLSVPSVFIAPSMFADPPDAGKTAAPDEKTKKATE